MELFRSRSEVGVSRLEPPEVLVRLVSPSTRSMGNSATVDRRCGAGNCGGDSEAATPTPLVGVTICFPLGHPVTCANNGELPFEEPRRDDASARKLRPPGPEAWALTRRNCPSSPCAGVDPPLPSALRLRERPKSMRSAVGEVRPRSEAARLMDLEEKSSSAIMPLEGDPESDAVRVRREGTELTSDPEASGSCSPPPAPAILPRSYATFHCVGGASSPRMAFHCLAAACEGFGEGSTNTVAALGCSDLAVTSLPPVSGGRLPGGAGCTGTT
jgi:hypothetical protein